MAEKKNITYLLGAGASAKAIPVVDGLRERMKDVAEYLSRYFKGRIADDIYERYPSIIKEKSELIHSIYRELYWLLNESENHQTIDTLAKKYFVIDHESLNRLKRALITYFTLEQCFKIPVNNSEKKTKWLKERIDKRYDNLIASVIHPNGNKIEIQGNIKIITWNYDMQLEMAFASYFSKSLHELKENLQIHPNRQSLHVKDGGVKLDLSQFAAIKLNGNALFDFPARSGNVQTLYDKVSHESKADNLFVQFLMDYDELFGNSNSCMSSCFDYFNFAWESYEQFKSKYEGYYDVIKAAEQIAEQTKILVVVGYSFPFFNSTIDERILTNMKPEEIIIQDFDCDHIEERIKDLNPMFKNSEGKHFRAPTFKKTQPGKYFYIHPNT